MFPEGLVAALLLSVLSHEKVAVRSCLSIEIAEELTVEPKAMVSPFRTTVRAQELATAWRATEQISRTMVITQQESALTVAMGQLFRSTLMALGLVAYLLEAEPFFQSIAKAPV